MGKKSSVMSGVEVLDPDFDDEHWVVDQQMVDLLDRAGLDYDFVRIDLSLLPTAENFQDQVRNQPLIGTNVQAFAADMRRGDKFPTPTLDKALGRVDINNRLEAARLAGFSDIIVIRINKVLAVTERNLLAVRRNNKHGERMTAQETNEWALKAVTESGWSVEQAADTLNVDPTTLRRSLSAHRALLRAQQLGVEREYANLSKTGQYQLAGSNMHDGPFKAVVKLFFKHTVSAARQVELIARIANASSDNKQLAEVRKIDAELQPPTIGTNGHDESDTPVSTAAVAVVGGGVVRRPSLSFDDVAARLCIMLDDFFGDASIAKALSKGKGPKADAVKEIRDGHKALAGIIG